MLYYVIKIIFYITKKLFSYKIILILIINLINKNELKKILTNYINIFNKFNYILLNKFKNLKLKEMEGNDV